MDSNLILSTDEIRKAAPSVFAEQPAPTRSQRYAFIPTSQVVDALQQNNWLVTKAMESRTKIEANKGFTRHMLRFRQNLGSLLNVGDSRIEIVLVNSHNGTSAYSLSMGLFRLVCSNGMVVADSLFQSIRIMHTGNIVNDVLNASADIIARAPKVLDTVREWGQIHLTAGEQLALAESAHQVRFPEGSAIKPDQLLRVHRHADNGNSLWQTFNRIQENVIKGGAKAYDPEKQRRVRAREVKNISGNINLNKALWTLGERMAELKGVAY